VTNPLASRQLARWIAGAGIASVLVLAAVVLLPGGFFWSAGLAAGLVGAMTATVLLVRSRSRPSLAQVIATAQATSRRDAVAARQRP
jgi:hypothetical protein